MGPSRPSRLHPVSEAVGPKGQAGSAWFKIHFIIRRASEKLKSGKMKAWRVIFCDIDEFRYLCFRNSNCMPMI